MKHNKESYDTGGAHHDASSAAGRSLARSRRQFILVLVSISGTERGEKTILMKNTVRSSIYFTYLSFLGRCTIPGFQKRFHIIRA